MAAPQQQQQQRQRPGAVAAAGRGGGPFGKQPAGAGRIAYRSFALAFAAAYFLSNAMRGGGQRESGGGLTEYLWPWGTARLDQPRVTLGKVDYTNDSLRVKHGRTQRIYERLKPGQERPLLVGIESVFFDKRGTMYGLTNRANLVTLTDFEEEDEDGVKVTATVNLVKHIGFGRPLAGKFGGSSSSNDSDDDDEETLYIADPVLGLTRIQNAAAAAAAKNSAAAAPLEIASNTVVDGDPEYETPIKFQITYANHVAVGPKTGKAYFSDSTEIFPDRVVAVAAGSSLSSSTTTKTSWDIEYAAMLEIIRGTPTGKILQFDPATGESSILSCCYLFANGVAVDKDETFLLFAETGIPRIWKYHLQGRSKGQADVLLDSHDLPGYVDNIDCSSWSHEDNNSGYCYAVVAGKIAPVHKLLNMVPNHDVQVLLRNLLMLLPRWMAPDVNPKYAAVLEIDPTTGTVVRTIQDPTGKDINRITGATYRDRKLYLGSLTNDYVGVYKL